MGLPASCWQPQLARAPRAYRTARTGYAYPPPAYCTYPEAQGSLPPGPHVLYVLGTRASLGRSVPTMSRGYHPQVEYDHTISVDGL